MPDRPRTPTQGLIAKCGDTRYAVDTSNSHSDKASRSYWHQESRKAPHDHGARANLLFSCPRLSVLGNSFRSGHATARRLLLFNYWTLQRELDVLFPAQS
jgi:hypothetical protein